MTDYGREVRFGYFLIPNAAEPPLVGMVLDADVVQPEPLGLLGGGQQRSSSPVSPSRSDSSPSSAAPTWLQTPGRRRRRRIVDGCW